MAGHGCQGSGWVFPADGTGRSAGVLLPGVVVTQAVNLPALTDGASGVVSSCHAAVTLRSGVPVGSACG